MTLRLDRVVMAAVLVCLTAAVGLAQTTTTTETKQFKVIAVDGNHLVVSLPEGTKEMNVPDDFRFTVDGRQLSVRELRPGMSGTATVTTRTTLTPVTVTEVKNGTVLHATPVSIIVRTDEGLNKMFTQSDVDKRNIRIMREGKPAQISDFRANDRLSATIVTSMPPKVLTEKEVQATLARSAPAAARTAAAQPAPEPPVASASAGTSSAAPTLPKTASPLPLLGLAGLLSLAAGIGLSVRRCRSPR
jgi:LPXTG-motif cell wall-anchored protein